MTVCRNFLIVLGLWCSAGLAWASNPPVEWLDGGGQAALPRSLPPLCDICLHGEVGYRLLSGNNQVELSVDYIVNYNDYGVPTGRSGTLALGLFLFPENFETLQGTNINPYNHANVLLSSLAGNEAYFADVRELANTFNVPSTGRYFAYLALGEIIQLQPLRIALKDFAVMHPLEQSACAGNCVQAVGGGGGDSAGVGQGGGSEGGGNREPVNKGEAVREPTSRRECSDNRNNVARPDNAVVSSGTATLIPVLANDTTNREGGFALSIDQFPSHGSAAVEGDVIRYTPNPGFVGQDGLRYRIGSVCGLSSFARVDIQVEPNTGPASASCPLEVKLPEELAERTENTSLLNISTRGLVGDCNDTLRAGFINADSETTYFIRGRGPSLGGGNPLLDPRIRLFRLGEQEELASNDDWRNHPSAACLVEGGQLMPSDEREAGLMITLPPGAYIAVLESADANGNCSNVYGNGIIEVNDVRLFPDDVQP